MQSRNWIPVPRSVQYFGAWVQNWVQEFGDMNAIRKN